MGDYYENIDEANGDDWLVDQEERRLRLYERQNQNRERAKAKARYDKAQAAKVGEMINCPGCNKAFVKKRYNTSFCSNAKTHGRHNCKDRYWNLVRG